MPLTTQAPLLNLDMPSWGYTANGVQLLADGDAEAVGVGSWTVGGGATLTKQTTNPHGGYQCLRVAGGNGKHTYQVLLTTIGRTYRISGWARGDGTSYPGVLDGGGPVVWTGTTSTSWQYFDVVYVAAGLTPYFWTYAGAGYVEWDDLRLEWCPASTRNLGTLGGYALLGDGVTTAGFPTQAFAHGMTFDGATDYLYRASEAALSFTTGAGDELPFSIEGLVYHTGDAGCVLAAKGQYGTTCEYCLYCDGPGRAAIIVVDAGNAAYIGRITASITNRLTNVVFHVAATYDGTRTSAGAAVYLNGARSDTANVTAGVYTRMGALGGPFRVGNGAGVSNSWPGAVYNLALYPFALTPGEVAGLCRARFGLRNRGA